MVAMMSIGLKSPLILMSGIFFGHFAAPSDSILKVSFPDSCRSKFVD